jgi:hypothetical protein
VISVDQFVRDVTTLAYELPEAQRPTALACVAEFEKRIAAIELAALMLSFCVGATTEQELPQ